MRRRIVVVPLVQNDESEYLICRMPPDRGVFPGQWGLPGGGMEEGELVEETLRREVREELGIEIHAIEPLFFKEEVRDKLYRDGTREPLQMLFLLFRCRAATTTIRLNEEFDQYAWAAPATLASYDLNSSTRKTFEQAGVLTKG